jgi:hypothetical protein
MCPISSHVMPSSAAIRTTVALQTAPGQTPFTRIPRRHSRGPYTGSLRHGGLDALYVMKPICARKPETALMLTIAPPPAARMCGIGCFAISEGPTTEETNLRDTSPPVCHSARASGAPQCVLRAKEQPARVERGPRPYDRGRRRLARTALPAPIHRYD